MTYLPLVAQLNGRQLSTVATICPNDRNVSELCHLALFCLERRVYALLDQKLPFRTRQQFGRLYGLLPSSKAAVRSASECVPLADKPKYSCTHQKRPIILSRPSVHDVGSLPFDA